MSSEKIVNLTSEDFATTIAKGITLVDFWAAWCRPCKMLAPIVEQIAEDFDGQIKVAKVDIDAHGPLAQLYSVMSIPTLLLFKDGKEIDKTIGVIPKKDIEAMIKRHL